MEENHRSLRVFLSHASDDKPNVRNLYRWLIEKGFDAWLDEEKLIPGQEWQIEIEKAVQNSDVIIICLSSYSISKEGYVQKEIRSALDKAQEKPDGTIFLIPARLEDCEVPFRLQGIQYVDLFIPEGFSKLERALNLRKKELLECRQPPSQLPEYVTVWSHEKSYLRHTYHINALSITSDDSKLASCSGDRNAIVWEIDSGKPMAVFKHDRWVGSVALLDDNTHLITSDGNGLLRVWNYRDRVLVQTRNIHEGPCRSVNYSPHRKLLASGGGDSKVQLWSIPDLEPVATLEGHTAEVRRVAFNSTGTLLVSGGEDGRCNIWDIDKRENQVILDEPFNTVRSVAFSHNDSYVAIVDSEGYVHLWSATKQEFLWQIQKHDGPAIGLAFHPQGRYLATSGQDKNIYIWDVKLGVPWLYLAGHEDSVTSLVFSSDGNKLFSASRDKSIRLWNLKEHITAKISADDS